MTEDLALQRAAGVIMWYLSHGGDIDEAVARASNREPELTEADLRSALTWAQAGLLAAELFRVAPPEMTLGEILDKAGVPWRDT